MTSIWIAYGIIATCFLGIGLILGYLAGQLVLGEQLCRKTARRCAQICRIHADKVGVVPAGAAAVACDSIRYEFGLEKEPYEPL